MEYAEFKLDYESTMQRFQFYNLGDVHNGAVSFDYNSFLKTVKEIADNPFAWWFGMGDDCEFINCDDKRFDPKNLAPRHRDHIDNLAVSECDEHLELIEPIEDKCLGKIGGNHDDLICRKYHFDPLDYIIRRMNERLQSKGLEHRVPNLGYGKAIVRVLLRHKGDHMPSYPVLFNLAHGWGGGEYPGGNLNRLVRLSANDDADVIMRGHVHKMLSYLMPVFRYPRKGRLVAIKQSKALLICGSYYKTYQEGVTSYAEQRDYAPVETGSNWVKIKITPPRLVMEVGGGTTIREQE